MKLKDFVKVVCFFTRLANGTDDLNDCVGLCSEYADFLDDNNIEVPTGELTPIERFQCFWSDYSGNPSYPVPAPSTFTIEQAKCVHNAFFSYRNPFKELESVHAAAYHYLPLDEGEYGNKRREFAAFIAAQLLKNREEFVDV